MKHIALVTLAVLTLGILVVAGCSQPAQETQLLPPDRDGIFYLNFAEAQSVAQANDKLIMLELWRPG